MESFTISISFSLGIAATFTAPLRWLRSILFNTDKQLSEFISEIYQLEISMVLGSRYSSRPYMPHSLPIPDCLNPP